MRNTKSAFTLVELIVVITILAILGTIAFISLQGYSAEARNAKRTSDLSSIASALSVKLTNGMGVLAAVGDSTNTGSIALAGKAAGTALTDGDYNAGIVNYTALEMKASEFQDPNADEDYVIGATTLAGGVYELAASKESDGDNVALVTGMYNPRTTATSAGGVSSNKFTIDITETGKFKKGDIVNIVGNTSGDDEADREITRISTDGTTITFSGTGMTTDVDATIALEVAESDGLIFSKAHGSVVTNGNSVLPY